MNQIIAHVTYLVRDYDEAIAFFADKLRFDILEDTPQGGNKRWVLIRPRGTQETSLLLAKVITPPSK